jgi:hypothetical protein
MWQEYDDAPLLVYLVGVLMTAMLMMRLVPADAKNTTYRVLVKDSIGTVVTFTSSVLSTLPPSISSVISQSN